MRSKKSLKQYPIDQSPIYKLKGLGQLEKLLHIKPEKIQNDINSYNVFPNKKGRLIQSPVGILRETHKRLRKLLGKIALPDYVFSKKGCSYVGNAAEHVGDLPMVKTDISGFYPSISSQMVYRMFVREFCCAEDIARLLADICCFGRKHLPTGSPISDLVAFFSVKPMLDNINELADANQCKMTIYVDDIALSGVGATKELLKSY